MTKACSTDKDIPTQQLTHLPRHIRTTMMNHLWHHFLHWIKLQTTHSPQTQQSNFKTLLFFPNNNCIPFVRPFPSTAFLHLTYLFITSFNYSPHKTRSSAYNKSINEPSLTSSVWTFTTMVNKSGVKADPWWTSTFTENELDCSLSTETAILQPF